MANTPSTRVADSTLEVSDSRYARTEPSFLLHWIEFTYAFPSSSQGFGTYSKKLPHWLARLNYGSEALAIFEGIESIV